MQERQRVGLRVVMLNVSNVLSLCKTVGVTTELTVIDNELNQ